MSKKEYKVIAKHLAPVFKGYQSSGNYSEETAHAALDMLCAVVEAFSVINPDFDLPTFARAVAGEDSNIAWIITGDEDLNTDVIEEGDNA